MPRQCRRQHRSTRGGGRLGKPGVNASCSARSCERELWDVVVRLLPAWTSGSALDRCCCCCWSCRWRCSCRRCCEAGSVCHNSFGVNIGQHGGGGRLGKPGVNASCSARSCERELWDVVVRLLPAWTSGSALDRCCCCCWSCRWRCSCRRCCSC